MKKKALAFAAMACSVAMLLSACGGSNSNAASGDTAGSNIITAYNSEPQNPLIPGNTNETGGGKPVDLLFSRLVSFDKDGKASNEVAESITPNDDATQYTIKIKSGWKFTDGTPVTAESFTKAWSYVANAKNAQKCSSFFSAIAGYDDLQKDGLKGDEQLSGLKVVDDTTFTVDLNQSDSVFPVKVGYSAFARVLLQGPEGLRRGSCGQRPVQVLQVGPQQGNRPRQEPRLQGQRGRQERWRDLQGLHRRLRRLPRHSGRQPRRDGIRPGCLHQDLQDRQEGPGLLRGRLRHPDLHHPVLP